ncbi:MAG: hypothetical protein PW789_15500 [Edaphobacter sp.]|uniref:hypothetical protein n=1 Tax=Edaphobacter sp. TaxID=1934404 RepID=UPI002394E6D0|nr:hypothetical protein [Edaphobacter sp.]MDE1177984.1 hypothetical protein [Edaphobacter sp.]
MEAYVRLDPRIGATGERAEMAARVCVAISGKSQFRRVAMLLRDAEARLYVAAHAEMEPDVLEAVRQWAEVAQQRELSGGLSAGIRLGVRSLVVCFGEPAGRGVVVPVWMEGSRVAGALVVMASSVLEVRRRDAHEAVVALEALATKLGRSMERSEMLMRAVELPVAEVVRSQSAVIGEVA